MRSSNRSAKSTPSSKGIVASTKYSETSYSPSEGLVGPLRESNVPKVKPAAEYGSGV